MTTPYRIVLTLDANNDEGVAEEKKQIAKYFELKNVHQVAINGVTLSSFHVVSVEPLTGAPRHIPPRRFAKYDAGDYHWRDYERGTKYKRHADRVAAWIKESKVLDIGAGDGKITSMIGAVGIDNEPEGVRLAKAHGVDIILGDAYHLPYADGEFESVLMADVLEHFEFPEKALAEARRVLTQYIYITTPPKRADGQLTDKYHYFELAPDELKTLVEGAGFVLEGDVDVVLQNKVMYAKFRRA